MSGQELFNELCRVDDAAGMVAALSDEALRLLNAHIAREGEGNGEHGDVCGAAVMESWARFTGRSC